MEVETHHHEAHDRSSKFIGLQTAILAILLSIFTILSHRAHTDTIIAGNKANNGWSHYQAKRIRAYQIEMNTKLIKLLGANNPEVPSVLHEYDQQSEKYKEELEQIKTQTEDDERSEETAHHKGSVYDLAEGLLEIAMILSSLYFLTKKNFFPGLALLLGIAGFLIGVTGLLIH